MVVVLTVVAVVVVVTVSYIVVVLVVGPWVLMSHWGGLIRSTWRSALV